MKILLYADPHFVEQSSIIRSQGEKYSKRLENVIKTINWIEELARNYSCCSVVCLGDFFDKSILSSKEITALNDIKFLPTHKHYFICGNHEMGNNNSDISSAKIFSLLNFEVIDKYEYIWHNDYVIHFLPYMLEKDRKPLKYILNTNPALKNIVFSHNDIAGINMGGFITNTGFSIEEIEESADIFINGHIHNQAWLNNKKTILNLGNITGLNFSEDALSYSHQVAILDTDDLSIKFIDNPYTFNFYKLDFSGYDIDAINTELNSLKDNAIVSVKVDEDKVVKVGEILRNLAIVEEYRIISVHKQKEVKEVKNIKNTEDHLKQFSNFMLNTIGNTEIVQKELSEVCK